MQDAFLSVFDSLYTDHDLLGNVKSFEQISEALARFCYYACVITPFLKALLRLSKRHYYAFLKSFITSFDFALLHLSKMRYNAFRLRIITPF